MTPDQGKVSDKGPGAGAKNRDNDLAIPRDFSGACPIGPFFLGLVGRGELSDTDLVEDFLDDRGEIGPLSWD